MLYKVRNPYKIVVLMLDHHQSVYLRMLTAAAAKQVDSGLHLLRGELHAASMIAYCVLVYHSAIQAVNRELQLSVGKPGWLHYKSVYSGIGIDSESRSFWKFDRYRLSF